MQARHRLLLRMRHTLISDFRQAWAQPQEKCGGTCEGAGEAQLCALQGQPGQAVEVVFQAVPAKLPDKPQEAQGDEQERYAIPGLACLRPNHSLFIPRLLHKGNSPFTNVTVV